MIRYKKDRSKRERRKASKIELCVVGIIICGMISLPFFFLRHHFFVCARSRWNSTQTQVLGTRIGIAYATDAGQAHAATFYYRAEAEVQYVADGKQIHTWLPASRATGDLVELQIWLSDKRGKLRQFFGIPPNRARVKSSYRALLEAISQTLIER